MDTIARQHARDGQPSCKLQGMMRANLIMVSTIRHPRPGCGGRPDAAVIMDTTHTPHAANFWHSPQQGYDGTWR